VDRVVLTLEYRRIHMKKLIIVVLVLIFGVAIAQQAEEPAENEQAMVRVAHLAPDAPDIEIAVDGEPTFEALAFRDVSDYQSVSSGSVEIAVMAEGEEVVSGSHDFEAGSHYTLVVLHAEAEAAEEEAEEKLRVLIFADEVTTPPGDDEALVRVLHANAEVGDVDVASEEREIVTGLAFAEATGYFSVAADAGLEIREVETGEAVTEVGADELEQGRIYTVFLSEDEAGEPDLIIQEDDIMVEEDEVEPEEDEDMEEEDEDVEDEEEEENGG
jgi:hypothetical protein